MASATSSRRSRRSRSRSGSGWARSSERSRVAGADSRIVQADQADRRDLSEQAAIGRERQPEAARHLLLAGRAAEPALEQRARYARRRWPSRARCAEPSRAREAGRGWRRGCEIARRSRTAPRAPGRSDRARRAGRARPTRSGRRDRHAQPRARETGARPGARAAGTGGRSSRARRSTSPTRAAACRLPSPSRSCAWSVPDRARVSRAQTVAIPICNQMNDYTSGPTRREPRLGNRMASCLGGVSDRSRPSDRSRGARARIPARRLRAARRRCRARNSSPPGSTEGRAGEMRYLERRHGRAPRSPTRRGRGRARSSRSAFRTGRRRRRAATGAATLRGRIAAYALGRDYHDRVGDAAPRA